ncbi:hypothetical protein [Paraburkholderia sartisoli]|uniref:Dolichyl-phosphate-mannose-protein mannosyltransferase n=1 Tax=Paraburkholderia sartisoli TaxID=83784 RepID=A0A1H4EEN1_9BURK|nr:hypothetical protein [Paraburkholderia sartisoli]SEA83416.1 hypothetical protein SAMN05192564_103305 [Paraburkholderia sartisoli]
MKLRYQRALLLILVLAVFVWLARYFMPFPANFEDSFIMYRYAQNGADGFPYEWNRAAGTVQGMTGVAWVTLVTLVMRITRLDVISANSYGCLVFSILTLLAIYATAVRHFSARNGWLAVCPLVAIVSSPFFIRAASNGLETSITVFFVALSIYLLGFLRTTGTHPIWAGIFSGLTVLVRPDLPIFPASLFFFGLALADATMKERVKGCITLAVSAFLAALGALFIAYVLTGTALPLAASLKFAMTDLLLGRLPGNQYRFILGFQLAFLSHLLPLVILALISTALLERANSKPYLPVYLACAVYFAYLFTVLPIVDVAYRFQLPVLIGLSFAMVHFFDFIVKSPMQRKHGTALILAITALLAVGNVSHLFADRKESEFLLVDHTPYEKIGRELRDIPGVSIASSEAGKLAFYSQKKFFDTVGLNDLFVARNKKRDNYPELLSNYLRSDFGIPDIYVRPFHAEIDSYAFLEIVPDFDRLYECNKGSNAERLNLVVCVYRFGPHVHDVFASIQRTGLGIEFP